MSERSVIPLKKTVLLLIVAITAALLAAAPAGARSTQDVFFEAPRDLTARGSSELTRAAAFDEIASLGVKALRVNLPWFDVAPAATEPVKPAFDATDPAAYDWGNYGLTIDRAKQLGWKVLISPSSPVPKWATAAKADHVTRPSAAEFELFTTAAARRFGSSQVLWSIWNEPNLPRFLKPQLVRGKPAAGRIYRELFLAGQRGIKAGGQTSAPILFGETSPVGLANDGRLKPLVFLRDAFCLNSKYKKADKKCGRLSFSGVAHHPYRSTGGIPKNKDDVTYQVIGRLTSALDKAAKAKAILRNRPIYMTEFGIQSWPDKLFGVSQQQQVEERARAERMAYFNGRVRGFSQYLLTDDDAVPGAPITRRWPGFESGLREASGKKKPSFDAFRLVLDARPKGKKSVSLWGLVRPANGRVNVVIERRTGKKFARWKTVKTDSRGSFTATDKLRKKVQYRYRWTSPDGKLTSPYVRVFRG